MSGVVFSPVVIDGPFTLQQEGIEYGRFLSIQSCFHLSKEEPFTPDGLEILTKLNQLLER